MATDMATRPAAPLATGFGIYIDGVTRQVHERRRGVTTLLDDVNFSISPGELVAIVGPSGAGKTTLLETIAGVAPQTRGFVRYDDADVHATIRSLRGVIGFVPQNDTIHADLPLRHTLHLASRRSRPYRTRAAPNER